MSEENGGGIPPTGGEHDGSDGSAPARLPGLRSLVAAHRLNEEALYEPKRQREARREQLKMLLQPLNSADFEVDQATQQYPVPPGLVSEEDVPPDVPFSISLHASGKLAVGEHFDANLRGLKSMAYLVTTQDNEYYVDGGGLSEREPDKLMNEEEFSQNNHAIEIRGTLGDDSQPQTSMPLGWLVDPSSMIIPQDGEHGPMYRVIGPDDDQFQLLERLMKVVTDGVNTQDPQLQSPAQ